MTVAMIDKTISPYGDLGDKNHAFEWLKDAKPDADIPILKEAKAEYAKLQ